MWQSFWIAICACGTFILFNPRTPGRSARWPDCTGGRHGASLFTPLHASSRLFTPLARRTITICRRKRAVSVTLTDSLVVSHSCSYVPFWRVGSVFPMKTEQSGQKFRIHLWSFLVVVSITVSSSLSYIASYLATYVLFQDEYQYTTNRQPTYLPFNPSILVTYGIAFDFCLFPVSRS
jgi:hypothetical protein